MQDLVTASDDACRGRATRDAVVDAVRLDGVGCRHGEAVETNDIIGLLRPRGARDV